MRENESRMEKHRAPRHCRLKDEHIQTLTNTSQAAKGRHCNETNKHEKNTNPNTPYATQDHRITQTTKRRNTRQTHLQHEEAAPTTSTDPQPCKCKGARYAQNGVEAPFFFTLPYCPLQQSVPPHSTKHISHNVF